MDIEEIKGKVLTREEILKLLNGLIGLFSNEPKEVVYKEDYDKLKEELEEYKQIGIMQFNRPYAKRYLEERRKEIPNLLYPDSEEIYMDYYDLKDRIDKEIEYIKENAWYDYRDNEEVITIPKEKLLDILNGSDKE